ncbi:MAG: 2Fe-2S iron-sulfur cluster-binding protein [Candidatus Manganitrophaceae bacterium]
MTETIRIRINDQEIEVEKGSSVLAASMKGRIRHMHLCGGHGLCTTCRIRVVAGAEHLSPIHPYERISLRSHLSFSPNVRLACQAKVLGPVRIETIMPLIGLLDYKGR